MNFGRVAKAVVALFTGVVTVLSAWIAQDQIHGTAKTIATLIISGFGALVTSGLVYRVPNSPDPTTQQALKEHDRVLDGYGTLISQQDGRLAQVEQAANVPMLSNGVAGYGDESQLLTPPGAVAATPK